MNKNDEVIMKLVHYFVTEENYNPIVVNGVKDEIWLENQNGPYRIIRINSNNIFNKEQLNYDNFKIESIVKQIKKKTLSFNVDTLNILLNVNEDLELEGTKNIKQVALSGNNLDITNQDILEAFPNINEKLLKDTTGIDLIVNVTKDINQKTEQDNRLYERTFKPKKIFVTYFIIAICLVMLGVSLIMDGPVALKSITSRTALILGGMYEPLVKGGQIWRLVTYAFLHVSLIHFAVNMYSLFIIGTQMETFIGKWKYIAVYLMSAISGGLLSGAIRGEKILSIGASGAIFGLLGALLYFGYHYRTYLGQTIKSQVIPVLAINLGIGFIIPGIDNFCHLGGLVGGLLTMMALGIDGKSKTYEKVNGMVCLLMYLGFLIFFIFFK